LSRSFDTAVEKLRRRFWLALFVFVAGFGAVISITRALPNLYHADATVLVESQRVSEAFVQQSVIAELETRMGTIRQEVMSRARLVALITQLNLYPELQGKGLPPDALVERMRRDIELSPTHVDDSGRGSTIGLLVGFNGRDPQTVAVVANRLAAFYIDENARIRSGQAARTAEFLKSQLDDIKADLTEQERLSSAYKLSHSGELPQQVQVNLVSLERLNTQLRLNSEHQIRATDRKERLGQQLADSLSKTPEPVPMTPRATQLAKLRQELAELRRHFTDEYPEVARVQREIAVLESDRVGSASAAPQAPIVDANARLREDIAGADAELKALRDEEASLRQAIANYEQRVDNVPKREEELQALSRDYETTKERYQTLLKRYEEAQLSESLEQEHQVEHFRVLDAALPPGEPAGPNRLRLVIIGFLFSLALVAGAVFAVEQLDTSFHDVDDLRASVSVPTIFSVPRVAVRADAKQRWRRLAIAVVSVVAIILVIAGSGHLAAGNERLVRLVSRGRM